MSDKPVELMLPSELLTWVQAGNEYAQLPRDIREVDPDCINDRSKRVSLAEFVAAVKAKGFDPETIRISSFEDRYGNQTYDIEVEYRQSDEDYALALAKRFMFERIHAHENEKVAPIQAEVKKLESKLRSGNYMKRDESSLQAQLASLRSQLTLVGCTKQPTCGVPEFSDTELRPFELNQGKSK
jgi:chorismate mutase